VTQNQKSTAFVFDESKAIGSKQHYTAATY